MDVEKDSLPKELIEVLDSLEYEESGYLEINSFDFINDDVLFKFSRYIGNSESRESQLWQVKIMHYKDFNISFNKTHNYLKLYTDHIALKQYETPLYELYFKSLGNNSELLYVSIMELHRDVFNNFICMKYINSDLFMLCNTTSGLFARVAKPVLEYYFDCLQKAGRQPYFFKPNIRKAS